MIKYAITFPLALGMFTWAAEHKRRAAIRESS
jgi:hypothetical protein